MSLSPSEAGCLILVVGPSGAGKDTLLDAARRHYRNDSGVRFPTRTITRPADAGGETHHAVNDAEFDRLLNAKAFALHWQAHGLKYGVDANIQDDLRAGRDVIVNVSRAILDDARQTFPRVAVASIVVPAAILADRLSARGREDETDLAARLARAEMPRPAGPDVIEVDNSSDPFSGAQRFIDALDRLRRGDEREAAE